MRLFRRQRRTFQVTMHLNGRHPYLTSTHLDYPSRDITFSVKALNWNDAENQAFRNAPREEYWSCWVVSIAIPNTLLKALAARTDPEQR
jgi:hypothetical protein